MKTKITKKKLIILFICLILVPTLLLSMTGFSLAEEKTKREYNNVEEIKFRNENPIPKEDFANEKITVEASINDINDVKKQIDIIELELENENSSVLQELNNQISNYNSILLLETSEEECGKLQDLIGATQRLIDEYSFIQNNPSTRGTIHLIYTPAVSAVVSYFLLNDYVLAAELLLKAYDNDIMDTYYTPHNVSAIWESDTFKNIVNGSSKSGSSSFPNSGTAAQKDLYYALHGFNYTKSDSGSIIVLTDRYDFDKDVSGYDGISEAAISLMYKAQVAGTIVPFYSNIQKEGDNVISSNVRGSIVIMPDSRYNENIVALGAGEYKDYNVLSSTARSIIFQTFGTKDAYLELYDSKGVKIASNDDNGYLSNAYLSYKVEAWKFYKIRVRFYSSSMSGLIKLATIPSDTYQSHYEQVPIHTGTSYQNSHRVVLSTYTDMFRFQPTKADNYVVGTDQGRGAAYLDMYLHVIDPRSVYPIGYAFEGACVQNDNGYPNQQAGVLKAFADDVPYLLLLSSPKSGSYQLFIDRR